MVRRLYYLGKQALAWILLFQFARFLFYVYQYVEDNRQPPTYLAQSAWHGLKMDVSFTGYLLVLPTILMALTARRWEWYRKFLHLYTSVMSVLIASIVTVDLEIYRSWGFRLDATPLRYLSNITEVSASLGSSPLFFLAVLFLLFLGLMILISYFVIHTYGAGWQRANKWGTPFLFLFCTAMLIIPIRGGLQLAPMNQSAVYYSSNNFANQMAVNASWNFFSSLIKDTGRTDNPFAEFSKEEADQLLSKLKHPDPSSINHIQTDSSTNVILIIWESFTAKIVSSLGGVPGVAPRFDSLSQEGIFFTRLYATGDRSDKGLIGILSGYPAQPTTSIITIPSKTATLPSLPKYFRSKGYHTSFYYGGETEFANIKSYLLQQGFDRIVDKSKFKARDMNSKWGAHDHIVFNRLLSDLDAQPTPFFTTLFTLSSHEPFEVPAETVIKGTDNEHKFLNAHHYTDASLGAFIDQAKTKSWWKNTLIVIVADHGHPLPVLSDKKIDQFRIPMLWLGGVVRQPGVTIDTLGSQTDLASTLLGQMNHPSDDFQWSNNLFKVNRTPYAFYAFNNGFGWVTPKGDVVFDNTGKREIEKWGESAEKDKRTGMAYLQTLFDDFLSR